MICNLLLRFICIPTFLILSIRTDINAQPLHYIKQKPGTEDSVSAYFRELNLNEDTLFAVFLPPMGCPRCEGLINPFFIKLKEVKPKAQTALFTFYPLIRPIKKYLAKRHFLVKRQIVFTKSSSLLNYFYSSTGTLEVPVFVKFDTRNGKLLRQLSSLGLDLQDSTVLNFIKNSDSQNLPRISKSNQAQGPIQLELNINNKEGGSHFPLNILRFVKRCPVKDTKAFPISLLYKLSFSDNRFVAQDDISLSIVLFKKKKDSWQLTQVIAPGEEDLYRYIAGNVSDSVVALLKKMNLLNTMYFAPQLTQNNQLLFTASLPHVYWEDKAAEALAYKNKLVIIDVGLGSASKKYIGIQYHDTIDIKHTKAYFSEKYDFVIMPIAKGWPTAGTSLMPPDSVQTNENPFSRRFYRFTPALAIFNKKGAFIQYLGQLPELYKKYRLGYAYADYLFYEQADKLYVLEKNCGIMNVFRLPSLRPIGQIELFKQKLPELPIKSSFAYIKTFKQYLSNQVTHFIVNKGNAFLLINKQGNRYLKCISLDNPSQTKKLYIADKYNGIDLGDLYFIEDDNGYRVASLIQANNNTFFYLTKENPL